MKKEFLKNSITIDPICFIWPSLLNIEDINDNYTLVSVYKINDGITHYYCRRCNYDKVLFEDTHCPNCKCEIVN
jgi:hypothetical protein